MPTATAALAAASAPTGFPSAIHRRCAAWRSLNTSSHLAEAARSSPRAAERSGWHFASARLYADSTFAADAWDAWDAAAGPSGGNSYSPSVASVASRHPAEASTCAPERSKSRCASARASSSLDARCSLSSMTRRCEATRSVMSRALFACFFAARASSLWRSVSAERCASEASRARRRVGDSGSGSGAGARERTPDRARARAPRNRPRNRPPPSRRRGTPRRSRRGAWAGRRAPTTPPPPPPAPPHPPPPPRGRDVGVLHVDVHLDRGLLLARERRGRVRRVRGLGREGRRRALKLRPLRRRRRRRRRRRVEGARRPLGGGAPRGMRAVRRAGPARGVAKAREDALHDGSDARLRGRRAGVLDASAREHALDDLLHRRVEVAPPRARLEQHAPTPEPHPRDEARGEGEQKRGPRGVRDGSNRLPAAQRGVVPRHVVVLHLVPGRPKRPTRATSMCTSPERSWASIHSSRQTRDRGAPRIRPSVRRLAGATFLRYHSKPVLSRFEKRRRRSTPRVFEERAETASGSTPPARPASRTQTRRQDGGHAVWTPVHAQGAPLGRDRASPGSRDRRKSTPLARSRRRR